MVTFVLEGRLLRPLIGALSLRHGEDWEYLLWDGVQWYSWGDC